MDYLVSKSLNYLISDSNVNDKITICKIKYGLYTFYSEISKLLIILTIATILGKVPEVIVIISSLAIRFFLGGCHCKTYVGCLLMSISLVFGIIMISNYFSIELSMLWQGIIVLSATVIILKIKTHNNPWRNHSEEKKLKNKKIAIFLIYSFIIVSNLFPFNIQNCIIFMVVYSILDFLRSVDKNENKTNI